MGKSFLLRAAALAAGLSFAGLACGPSNPSGSGGGGGTPFEPTGFKCSGKKVSFQTDVAPQVAAHCAAVEGCHVNMHEPDGAYEHMTTDKFAACGEEHDWVTPSDAEHSLMIAKLTNKNICTGSPMPKPFQTGSTWQELPAPILQTFYDWICQGATKD
jgi:hypothetical protein